MEWNVAVPYLGDLAHYAITPESSGIYQAFLLKYEGPNIVTPPVQVTLVRGATHRWLGSYEEPYFVEELGRAIEDRVRGGEECMLK